VLVGRDPLSGSQVKERFQDAIDGPAGDREIRHAYAVYR
jgi:hypothetical protein